MADAVKSRRPYHSPRRVEQARATRAAVLGAARELFTTRGYVATTIQAVADRAGVSVETVYATFGNKRALVAPLIDVAIAGDDAPVPILDRPWVRELREEPDPRRRVRILARNGRLILERLGPLFDALAGAAAADPSIAEARDRYETQRLEGQRHLVRIVARGGALREGLTQARAADVLFAIGSPEVYRLLTAGRGWSPERFERWYGETLERLLLD